MFLEKVKEIIKAEEAAAEKKAGVDSTVEQIIAKAHEDGKRLVEKAEGEADAEAEEMIREAESKSAVMLEQAKTDAKIDAVAQKVAAELHLPEAVKYLINAVFSEFVR